MRPGLVDRAWGVGMRPLAAWRRRVLWPMLGLRWWNWVDEWVLVGGRIGTGDARVLRREGVGAVVNLCAEIEDPLCALKAERMQALHLPTRDLTAPSLSTLALATDFIAANARREVRTYLHCAHGMGRGPTVAAAWLVRRGWTAEEALLVVRARRPVTSMRPAQREAVRSFGRFLAERNDASIARN